MAERILITLQSPSESCTCYFDTSTQSTMWVGLAKKVGVENALARIENDDNVLKLCVAGDDSSEGYSKYIRIPSDEEYKTSFLAGDNLSITALIRPYVPTIACYSKYRVPDDSEFIIGSALDSGIVYKSQFVNARHAKVSYKFGAFAIEDLDSENSTTVNGVRIPTLQPWRLRVGDVVQILDLIIAVGGGFFCINSPANTKLQVESLALISHQDIKNGMPTAKLVDDNVCLFYPSPRLSRAIRPFKLQVDTPPAKKEPDDQPVLMQIGPSFLMGISSVFMVANSVSQLAGGASPLTALPSIAMAVAMIGGSVVWPVVSRSYGKRKDERDEQQRTRMYVAYLDRVENQLTTEASRQANTLREYRRPVEELLGRAKNQSPLLMSHTSAHEDFLDLRVGVGDARISADIDWPQRHFSLSSDRMLDRVTELSMNPPELEDVPLAFNPSKHPITGILGQRSDAWAFLRGLIVQVCSLYSYQEVKILLIASSDEEREWGFLRSVGHFYDDTGHHRLAALSFPRMVEESLLIERELEKRSNEHVEMVGDYGTYYLVICANYSLAARSEAIKRLLHLRTNRGFSVLYIGETLRDLPRECGYIIDLTTGGESDLGIELHGKDQRQRNARMFERSDVSGSLCQFDCDIKVSRDDANDFALSLARVHLDIPEQRQAMPESMGFLEMFAVGNVSHLNIGQRWMENDASQSLQTPLGIDGQGELAYLDLHEKIHGPHGLIAGTTGSGKSEFIITYILSLCVNYSPNEVAFVLIDYKGGGLAGAFENERHHLPHLSGTITNLDGGSIRRSLMSISSELKRRQDIFNKAREITGESTMDIYKYISYYRQGANLEPMPHLFIIADEFAELKQQEPEFMEELISAARIGRSLGVHLILATQKPSGVVNDQIRSNSRFKVCLKVSDAADSREMLQRDDAASITRAGMYYLLVGYNESFSCGQAAYAGAPYVPSETYEPKKDTAIELLDAEGAVVARMRPQGPQLSSNDSEIEAVIRQIEEAARVTSQHAERLWLDPLPDYLVLEDLCRKYDWSPSGGLVTVVGEVDDPDHQNQFIYKIDLASAGNVLLYGAQGSNVDELIQSMLFSLAMNYGTDDLFIYGIDLGPGALTALEALPQCGGVVLPNQDERLQTLIRMIDQMRQDRQKMLSAYGGSIQTFNARSAERMPYVVVAIANLATLMELYQEYEDKIIFLTRECPRYGIHFIVSASATNSVRMRLADNFAVSIPTLLNDSSDYMSIFGSLHGIVPPQHEKRGLSKFGKEILEFQGASICQQDEDVFEVVRHAAQRMCKGGMKKAPAIPELPHYVTPDHMGNHTSKDLLPIGFSKSDMEPQFFDFGKSPYMLVLGNDNDSINRYLRGLREALFTAHDVKYKFIDTNALLQDGASDVNVITSLDEAANFIADLDNGSMDIDVIVFTSIVQTISSLPSQTSLGLTNYIASERGTGKISFVCATEVWRVRSIYDNWYKVISAYGNGIWCGNGFVDQTVFRFARALPEFRQPAERSDAFFVMRGEITWVRLLEATNEPKEDD